MYNSSKSVVLFRGGVNVVGFSGGEPLENLLSIQSLIIYRSEDSATQFIFSQPPTNNFGQQTRHRHSENTVMLDYDDSAFKFFFVSILAFYLIPATIYTLNVISSRVFAKVSNVFFSTR